MQIKDVLVHLDTFPDPTSAEDIDAAVAFASAIGAKLTAVAYRIAIPLESNRVADYLLGLSTMVAEEEARSETATRRLLGEFTRRARRARAFGEALHRQVEVYQVPDSLAREARTRDLTLVPLGGRFTGQREAAQTVVFQSGRPALIYTAGRRKLFEAGLRKVVVAWDGGAGAARAVGDALPILEKAGEVRILTVVGEKPSVRAGMADALVRHLAAHRIAAVVDVVEAKGRRIGQVLDAYLRRQAPDLLVMGAYGHSRVREFILGGATEHMLWQSKVATLLVH